MKTHTANDLDTYLDVPYQDNREAKRCGGQWDEESRAWFIPPSVDPDEFKNFHAWFEKAWRYAPECPKETDPLMWGQNLFARLQKWALEFKLSPASLRYWDISKGSTPIEEFCSEDAVVQIVWERGPALWALRLLQRDDYRDWGSPEYYLEPIDDWGVAVGRIE